MDRKDKAFLFVPAGIVTGMIMLFTYGKTIPYPKIESMPAQAQKLSALEREVSHSYSVLSAADENTVVAAAERYAKAKKEYAELSKDPVAIQGMKEYDRLQVKYGMKMAGISFGPVYAGAILGIIAKRRKRS